MTDRSDLELRASLELGALVDVSIAQGVPLGRALVLATIKLVADYIEAAESAQLSAHADLEMTMKAMQ